MRIRPAALEDSAHIAEVHLAAWRSAYAGIVSRAYLDSLSLEKRKDRWEEILRAGTEGAAASPVSGPPAPTGIRLRIARPRCTPYTFIPISREREWARPC
jgi:hypothetical protein